MIEFETFEIGPFTFEAQYRSGYTHAADPADREEHVTLVCGWNDWPTEIGRFPVDVTLDDVKRAGYTWLIDKLNTWKAEAEKFLDNLGD